MPKNNFTVVAVPTAWSVYKVPENLSSTVREAVEMNESNVVLGMEKAGMIEKLLDIQSVTIINIDQDFHNHENDDDDMYRVDE